MIKLLNKLLNDTLIWHHIILYFKIFGWLLCWLPSRLYEWYETRITRVNVRSFIQIRRNECPSLPSPQHLVNRWFLACHTKRHDTSFVSLHDEMFKHDINNSLTLFLCNSSRESPPDAAARHPYSSTTHSRHCVWQERDDGAGTAVVEAKFWSRTILQMCCWWRWCLCIPQRWCSHGNFR